MNNNLRWEDSTKWWEIILHGSLWLFLHVLGAEELFFCSTLSFQECLCNEKPWKIKAWSLYHGKSGFPSSGLLSCKQTNKKSIWGLVLSGPLFIPWELEVSEPVGENDNTVDPAIALSCSGYVLLLSSTR